MSVARPRIPAVWPVIHVSTRELAIRNAELAVRCGCTGVFLIHMDGRDDLLAPIAQDLKRLWPDLMVGLNYLTLAAPEALDLSLRLGMDATWSDSPGVYSHAVEGKAFAVNARLIENPTHLFFGSVAFKYQPPESNPERAAQLAMQLGMIPTTSGVATGVPPSVQKLAKMCEALNSGPLAVASGITPDNAKVLGGYLSHVLVSTGISQSFHEFDEALLRRLMAVLETLKSEDGC